MHPSAVASSSIHRQHSASSAKASNSREATIAVVRDASSTPGGSASVASVPRVTMAPLLLKPAVQSCLKNGYRLSLPFAATMPYPSPSILFPSVLEVPSTAADTSAGHALAELSRSIRVLEDGRRASDPDVKSEFEAALFAWVDQESKQASMGLGALASSRDDDDRSLVDEGGLDGYGADVEDSPYLGAEQYARGSRIHNGMHMHAKARALRRRDADDVDALGISIAIQAVEPPSVGVTAEATPPAHKEPRFSLTTDNIPRVGSPTELDASPTQVHPCDREHALSVSAKGWRGSSAGAYSPSMLKVPTIVLPQDSPMPSVRPRGATLPIVRTPYAFPARGEEQAAALEPKAAAAVPRPRDDPFASLNPFALEVKRVAPRPRSKSGPPSGPMCPRMPLMPQSSTSGSLTRLQARRPPALRLTNLPPAGAWAKAEIKANGRGLEGRDMTVRPVYDPRLHGPVPLSAPPFTTPKSKQTANPGADDGKRRASTSSKKTEQPASKLKLRGRAATDAKPLDLGLGLGITNVPQGGFPHPLPYRGVNAPEHTLSGSSDAASAVRREKMAAEKTRKHRGRFETLLAELTKPFDGRKRKASADAAALVEAAAVAAAVAKLATPAPAAPILADSARNAMSAWAKRTFEATTAKGKNAGKIDSPPSAFLASASVMEPTPVTPLVKIVPTEMEPEVKPKTQLVDKPVPALPEIVIQEEIKLTLPVLPPPARASPALSVRTGLRRDARNITVALPSCAITLNSGTTMSEMENSPLVPANAVPTAQRARRDAQGAALTANSRAAALALPLEKIERPRTGGIGEPPSPRRLAFGVLARQRAPCDMESRRAVSYGGMQRPRGPRRQSSQCRRAVSSNLRCATSMSHQGSQISAHSSSPMLREGSESSFGSFNGCSPRAEASEFDGKPKNSKGTPLLIDCSSPMLNLSPPRRNGDIAQMLGSRSPLTRICDEAKGLMGLALASGSVDGEDAKLLAFSGTAGSRSQASKENAPNSRAASVLSSPRQCEDAEDAPFLSAMASPAGGAAFATPSSAGGLVRQRLLRQRPQTPLDMLRSSRAASAAYGASTTDAGVDVASEVQAVLDGQTPSAALLAIALAAEALCERDADSISCFSGSTAVEAEALLPPTVQTTA